MEGALFRRKPEPPANVFDIFLQRFQLVSLSFDAAPDYARGAHAGKRAQPAEAKRERPVRLDRLSQRSRDSRQHFGRDLVETLQSKVTELDASQAHICR